MPFSLHAAQRLPSSTCTSLMSATPGAASTPRAESGTPPLTSSELLSRSLAVGSSSRLRAACAAPLLKPFVFIVTLAALFGAASARNTNWYLSGIGSNCNSACGEAMQVRRLYVFSPSCSSHALLQQQRPVAKALIDMRSPHSHRLLHLLFAHTGRRWRGVPECSLLSRRRAPRE